MNQGPDGTVEILVPDLGSDKTWRITRGEDGVWGSKEAIEYVDDLRGGGPRHVGVKGSCHVLANSLFQILLTH